MPLKSLLACLGALILLTAEPAWAQPIQNVGFQHLEMPSSGGAAVEIGVWYPTDAAPVIHSLELFEQTVAEDAPAAGHELPLIVISHGNGGGFAGHYDTALALAKAGFVVAALTHPGDNFHDQSRALDLPSRPGQLKRLVDYMLSSWPQHGVIDPGRIGAFGFSAGGYTVLTAAGGEADLSQMAAHCAEHPTFFDCKLMAHFAEQAGSLKNAKPVWDHDLRIKAVVCAAPAVGFAFGRAGLKGVTIPVQLWRAQDDRVLPQPYYAEAVRANLPTPPEYHEVPHAEHLDFLAPCSSALAKDVPFICQSEPGL